MPGTTEERRFDNIRSTSTSLVRAPESLHLFQLGTDTKIMVMGDATAVLDRNDALLGHLGLQRPVLVGRSLGGNLSQASSVAAPTARAASSPWTRRGTPARWRNSGSCPASS